MNALPPFLLRLARFGLFVTMACLIPTFSNADEIHLSLLPTGAMSRMGGYMPQRLKLSSEMPAEIKQIPPGIKVPLFGVLKLGPPEAPTVVAVILDESEGKPPRLFVEAAANGDLRAAQPATWTARVNKLKDGSDSTVYMGGASVGVAYNDNTSLLHIAMYRFENKFKDSVFYYSDYAREGEITLGDKKYKAMLADRTATGDFRGKAGGVFSGVQLFVDLNGDGRFDFRTETFDVLKPFNIGGITYEVAGLTASGDSFRIEKSTKTVAEVKAPQEVSVGKNALLFKAKTLTGQDVSFPSSYQGKLVILDFWATWCGPCVGELPHLTAAYEKFHPQGLEVLGISLDQAGAAQKLETFTKDRKMAWPQVYDGNAWSAEIAKLYNIHSIPSAFLVDGDTGVIIAAGTSLRGEALEKTLEEALAKKKAK
jgi:thiol-disulfide isomerase/thioredoxin